MVRNALDRRQQEYDQYAQEVQRAYQQWQDAQNFFQNVSEPELVDFAIFDVEAARRRYMYLLNKVRHLRMEEIEQEGIKASGAS